MRAILFIATFLQYVLGYQFAIELKQRLPQLQQLENASRGQMRTHVYNILSKFSSESQHSLVGFLTQHNVPHHQSWINNVVYADLTLDLVSLVEARSEVKLVRATHTASLITPVNTEEESFLNNQWHIDLVGASSVWELSTGCNVTVANIDTGVRFTHESLIGNYRGNNGGGSFSHDFNWFDPQGSREPEDGNGHGTHTMGTIAGTHGIGVAPGSRWIAAKGCRTILCTEDDLSQSAEWTLCPTPVGGGEPNCDLGADIVSNSWGGGQGDDWYLPYTTAWRAAGIIPVFAQGNSGPICGSANSPGDLANVIGVGATTRTDGLAAFSSRGPGAGGDNFAEIKPDISAPGSMITSASNRGDSLYVSQSGTSMACPVVAGVIALMLGANPSLSFDEITTSLYSTSIQDLEDSNECGGIPNGVFPNNNYGHGRVDADAAVRSVV
eukprot:Lithocolla_globosa_v1_NODE_379_length_4231_cov_15.911398.p2 type:complete len:440 gc:universal NODE_379_length_4231_cov_15.911398:2771-4090(+)